MNADVHTFTDSCGNLIEYGQYGVHSKVLVCFPGFGETYKNFENIARQLPNHTVIAINLYYVGRSILKDTRRYLTNDQWCQTFEEFLIHLQMDRFSVLGFSLGGRFAVATFSKFHSRMDHMILVAPDGVMKRWTYQTATFPVFFRQLFYLLMKYPQPYFLILKWLLKFNLVNPYIAKFSLLHLQDKTVRMRIYCSWITFKYLRLRYKTFGQLINSSSCTSTIIFGKKDKIIRSVDHHPFISLLNDTSVLILPFGHNRLVDNSVRVLQKILQ